MKQRKRVTLTAREKHNQSFDQGYFCAVATLIRNNGVMGVEKDLIRANRPKSFKHIDPYDMEVLKPVIKRMDKR